MLDAILRIATSGINAATKRVGAAASNIANAQDVSRLEPKPDDPPTFQPLTVAQSAVPPQGNMQGGGVQASYRPVIPAAIPVPDPQSPLADANGFVGLPNVDLSTQLVDMLVAQRSFQANLKTVQAAQEMQDQLLNVKS